MNHRTLQEATDAKVIEAIELIEGRPEFGRSLREAVDAWKLETTFGPKLIEQVLNAICDHTDTDLLLDGERCVNCGLESEE